MKSHLDEILASKEKEVEALIQQDLKNGHVLKKQLDTMSDCTTCFRDALKVAGLSVIAEIKRASPSKGNLSKIEDPAKLAMQYSQGGASAISVLTDTPYFKGSLGDLKVVVEALEALHPCPVLRKDFIIHPYQIAQSALYGASAILLIVSAVGDRLEELMSIAKNLGLEVLVEVHNLYEVEKAVIANAEIIGVNHRNLQTFEIDMTRSKELVQEIPKDIVKVAESGIRDVKIAHELHEHGFDAVLIGEMLVKHQDPEKLLADLGNA